MEKEPCTKFCGVLISSHEVIKLQSFESTVSDAVSANVQYILPLVSFTYICYFYEKKFFYTVYGLFDHFSWTYEVTKFWMNKLLIVAYM